MPDPNSIDHVNVKIFAQPESDVDLTELLPVFQRWIRDSICEELLIDVADYRHVPAGPGVILIGHEANYSLDNAQNKLGLLYNRKGHIAGTSQDRLRQAYLAALQACRRLEEEPSLRGRLHFDAGSVEVILNDRLLAPNTVAGAAALRPTLEQVFAELLGDDSFLLDHVGESRERLRFSLKTTVPRGVYSVAQLQSRA